jgi:hypothetical protein
MNKRINILFFLMMFLLSTFSYGQSNNSENLPKTKIDVQKKVDENGNIIRYDSTYSYSNSSFNNGFLDYEIDSIFKEFNSRFNMGKRTLPMFQDSLFNHFPSIDFYNDFDIDSPYIDGEIYRLMEEFRKRIENNNPFPSEKSIQKNKKGTEI